MKEIPNLINLAFCCNSATNCWVWVVVEFSGSKFEDCSIGSDSLLWNVCRTISPSVLSRRRSWGIRPPVAGSISTNPSRRFKSFRSRFVVERVDFFDVIDDWTRVRRDDNNGRVSLISISLCSSSSSSSLKLSLSPWSRDDDDDFLNGSSRTLVNVNRVHTINTRVAM